MLRKLFLFAAIAAPLWAQEIKLPAPAEAAIFKDRFVQGAGPDTLYASSSGTFVYADPIFTGTVLSDSAYLEMAHQSCNLGRRMADSLGATSYSCTIDSIIKTLSSVTVDERHVGALVLLGQGQACDTSDLGSGKRRVWTPDGQGRCTEGILQTIDAIGVWSSSDDTSRIVWDDTRIRQVVEWKGKDTLFRDDYRFDPTGVSLDTVYSARMNSGFDQTIVSHLQWQEGHIVGIEMLVANSVGTDHMYLRFARGTSSAISPRAHGVAPFSVHMADGTAVFANASRSAAQVAIVRPDGARVATLQVAPGATESWTPTGSGIFLWSARSGGITWSGTLVPGR